MNIEQRKISNGVKYPNFNEEKKLWKKGYKFVAGLDEAGRGPLAGPVVAAAVCPRISNDEFLISNKISNSKIKSFIRNLDLEFRNFGINDSKKLSEKKREEIYEKLIRCENLAWGVGVVSEKIIDKINILEATKLAMAKALKNLSPKPYTLTPNFLLIDGNFTLRQAQGEKYIPQRSIIKGDQKVFSVAAASIIAKVTRDRLMQKYHKKYPQYGFEKHKGYGTRAHFLSLEKFGPCKIHRKSFYPVRNLAETRFTPAG